MNKLQLYFNYYVRHHNPKEYGWYRTLNESFDLMSRIKSGIATIVDFDNSENKKDELEAKLKEVTEGKITSVDTFLNRFIFRQDNGVGNVKQGVVWDTDNNPQKNRIRENATASLIFNLISADDKKSADTFLEQLLESDRNIPAVHNRMMRTLFPNEFGSPDAPNKLDRLIGVLSNKLGISIKGDSALEKHGSLCQLIETDDPALRQMFTWDIYYMLDNEINLKKAVVFYGAPGTGKTFNSTKVAKQTIDQHRIIIGGNIGDKYTIQTVQFHPSYSYEDFIEGIRPREDGSLGLFNGTFKQFCKANGLKEVQLYQNEEFLNNENFKKLKYDFSQIKVNQLNNEQQEILQVKDKNLAAGITIQDVIEPAFFIIDEINRAELSKVFGELMYSLEYRGYEGKIRTQYGHLCKSSSDEATFYWEADTNWFFIPQNIYILATMNNVDRSVDAFDFALRRRFMWKEVHPNYHVITQILTRKGWGKNAEGIRNGLEELNKSIEQDDVLDKNYRIGQSYVLELAKLNPNRFDAQNKASMFIWDNFIQPLLEEYLKGLGNEQKSRDKIEDFKKKFLS